MQAPQSERPAYQPERETQLPRKINWWLQVASSGWDKPQDTIELREKARRSALLAWILLGVFAALILFIPTGFTYPPATISIIATALLLFAVIWLNRVGMVTSAGIVLVTIACLATFGVVLASPDGKLHLYYLPAYDFLVIPVILGASILPRISAFIVAAINIVLLYADLILQPKAPDMLNAVGTYTLPAVTARPVALLVITAVISYSWVRGMEVAIRRADRAEELRAIEQHFVQKETERTTRVEEFVQETINAIGALANGQEGLLLLPLNHPWQQQAIFINTQLKQFYKLKQANRGNNEQIAFAAETLLRLLQRVSSGQAPVSSLDPRRFTTRVALTDEIAKHLYFLLLQRQEPKQAPVRNFSHPFRAFPEQPTQGKDSW